jgi:hypothetical protein
MIELEYHWQTLTILALGLASVHIWFPWFDTRFATSTHRWMGFIGGIATGYVVLYMLPKIGRITAKLAGLDESVEMEIGHFRMYGLLLTAIVIYVVMIHLNALESRWSTLASAFDYGVHGAYSFLIGYVFVEVASQYVDVYLMIWLILGLHLIGMNHLLREMRRKGFDGVVRWMLSGLTLLGAGLGLITQIPGLFINGMTAFLAGIILVNVVYEELPLNNLNRLPSYLGGIVFIVIAFALIIDLEGRSAY